MLRLNLRVIPSAGPVKFTNNMRSVFQHQVVYPIFIAVQNRVMSGKPEAGALHRPDDGVGKKLIERSVL